MDLLFTLFLASLVQAAPLVAIDPGHEPSRPGSIGVCGKEEMVYNDEAAAALVAALDAKKISSVLTRMPGAEVILNPDAKAYLPASEIPAWQDNPRLYDRSALANKLGADLFLSLHHDSTVEEWQENAPGLCDGKPGKRLGPTFSKLGFRAGFSVFVTSDPKNPARYEASLKLARLIGKGMVEKLKRVPSTYHGKSADCASCKLLDAKYGVYEKTLAVLRSAQMPAVLVEVGVIADVADEMAVNSSGFRGQLAAMLRDALQAYLLPKQ